MKGETSDLLFPLERDREKHDFVSSVCSVCHMSTFTLLHTASVYRLAFVSMYTCFTVALSLFVCLFICLFTARLSHQRVFIFQVIHSHPLCVDVCTLKRLLFYVCVCVFLCIISINHVTHNTSHY